ncbi:hypothetical protein RCL1_008886 [Eukaryota sp. TZLM3-RCL]
MVHHRIDALRRQIVTLQLYSLHNNPQAEVAVRSQILDECRSILASVNADSSFLDNADPSDPASFTPDVALICKIRRAISRTPNLPTTPEKPRQSTSQHVIHSPPRCQTPPKQPPPQPPNHPPLSTSSLLSDFLSLQSLCKFWEQQSFHQHSVHDHLINSSNVIKMQAKINQLQTEIEGQKETINGLQSALMTCRELAVSQGNSRQLILYGEERSLLRQEVNILKQKLAETQKNLDIEREQNKSLRNSIEEIKGSIRTIIRIRPLYLDCEPKQGKSSSIVSFTDSTVTIKTRNGLKSLDFSTVLADSTSQITTFSQVEGLVHSFIDGYNVSILAYGATGSGKSYTISGVKNDIGVAQRFLERLFSILKIKHRQSSSRSQLNSSTFVVSVAISELYNDEVYDLIDGQKLKLRQRPDFSYFAFPQKWVTVDCSNEAIRVFDRGLARRISRTTAVNDTSSRSHCMFSVQLTQSTVSSSVGDDVITSKLVIVDLAGSERVTKSQTGSDPLTLKETQSINSSLSTLGDVVSSLAVKNKHVPYRNSKLTRLLQDVLSGESKTVLFANISPDVNDVQETLATLNFAHKISSVCTKKQKV